MIAWRQGEPAKGDWLKIEDSKSCYCTRASVPLAHAAADFIKNYKPVERGPVTLVVTDLYSNATLEVEFTHERDIETPIVQSFWEARLAMEGQDEGGHQSRRQRVRDMRTAERNKQ